VTLEDIFATSISNTASVTGYDPNTVIVTDKSNTVILLLNNLPPTISCPPAISTFTSVTSCETEISTGLSATYADPTAILIHLPG